MTQDGDGVPEPVLQFLLQQGVSLDEIAGAHTDGVLHLLVSDYLAPTGEAKFTPKDVGDLTGIPPEDVTRLWRALGFPDVMADEKAFTDQDLDALTTITGLVHFAQLDFEVALQLARVIGSSMARIAVAELAAAPGLARTEAGDSRAAEQLLLTAGATLPSLVRLHDSLWRRHRQGAVRRVMLQPRGDPPISGTANFAVGFADLVGFTTLSQQLSDEALAQVVARFEGLAWDTVASLGGRVVKMIGDEVMFVVPDTAKAAEVGLGLAEAYAGDDVLSDVRVALACGPMLARDGDYFGWVVNLANRMVKIARPGSVVVSGEVHDALRDDPRFGWRWLRPRYLKDFGRVPLWVITRAEQRPTYRERNRLRSDYYAWPGILFLLPEPARQRVERSKDRPPRNKG